MLYRFAADAVLLLHLAFIIFVVFGAMLAMWRRWAVAVHVPAMAWGVFIELSGRICPLTPLENSLRIQAGESGYGESFVGHYLLGIIYPHALTPAIQFVLAGLVIAVNGVIYGWLFYRCRR